MKRLLIFSVLAVLCGCVNDGPQVIGGTQGPVRRAPPRQDEVGALDLLPLKPGRVGWYRATRRLPSGERTVREIALFRAWDREAGIHLESVGLPGALRFVVKHDHLYVLAGDLDAAGYKLLLRGKRADLEAHETPAGHMQCLRLEHSEGNLVARHWFGLGRGLVGYELEVAGEVVLYLELLEEVAQGSPSGGYDQRSPRAFWKSYETALRRLDVEGLEGMFAPELLRHLRWAGDGDVLSEELAKARMDPKRSEGIAERIRLWMPDLLDVRLEPTGPWAVQEEAGVQRATAPGMLSAWLDGGMKRGRAELRLVCGGNTWQLAGFQHVKPR